MHNPQTDGAFYSMRITKDLFEKGNHLMIQGKITILFFSFEIDLTVKPGAAADGGGMFLWFKMTWKLGSLMIGKARYRLTPFW